MTQQRFKDRLFLVLVVDGAMLIGAFISGGHVTIAVIGGMFAGSVLSLMFGGEQ